MQRQVKRGLVLAGGGAKGAYAYGCLTVFREQGVEFTCVAGTSVGALNAAIWSRQAFVLGDALWSDLSFASVMPARRRRGSRWLYYAEGFSRVLVQLHLATWAGVPAPGRAWWAWSNGIVVALPILLVALASPFPTRFPAFSNSTQWLLSAGLLTAFTAWMLRAAQAGGNLQGLMLGKVLSIFLASLLVLTPPLLEYLVMLIWGGFHGVPRIGGLIVVTVLALTSAIAWLYLRGISMLSRIATRVTERSFFVNDRLRQQVSRVLALPGLDIPVYVCAALRKEVFTGWIDVGQLPRVHRTPLRDTLARDTAWEWVPRYVEVGALPADRAADLLLASAALPFGLLPPIEIGDGVLVDGGIVDNIPAFPLLEAGVDELYVVVLDHQTPTDAEYWDELLRRRWIELELQIRAAGAPLPPESVHRSEGDRWQRPVSATPPAVPRVVVIRPSSPIGRFLSGTLNFRGDYARRLMALGRQDAAAVLAGSGRERPV